jgi:SAM-dependent methyltransferase
MNESHRSKQAQTSLAKNISFFRDQMPSYEKYIQAMDTYKSIRSSINEAVCGIDHLLDIGNGGVFDYDVTLAKRIVALDLFLNDLPPTFSCPDNVTLKTGSALSIPEPDDTFDGVLMVMLLHHLVGKTVKESVANISLAVREAFRVLRPNGRLIIIESCVASWFYMFEQIIFPFSSFIINKALAHPATLQLPPHLLAKIVGQQKIDVQTLLIPKGRWVLQFGYKFPSLLTPANPYRFLAQK